MSATSCGGPAANARCRSDGHTTGQEQEQTMMPSATPIAPVQAPAREDAAASEFLTFRLGAGSYGVDILKVQEIRRHEPPTAIANAPAFIKGVINLRGVIVPILDLRVRFGL